MMSRIGMAPRFMCASLTICTLPQRLHPIRRNQDENTLNGSSRASPPVG